MLPSLNLLIHFYLPDDLLSPHSDRTHSASTLSQRQKQEIEKSTSPSPTFLRVVHREEEDGCYLEGLLLFPYQEKGR